MGENYEIGSSVQRMCEAVGVPVEGAVKCMLGGEFPDEVRYEPRGIDIDRLNNYCLYDISEREEVRALPYDVVLAIVYEDANKINHNLGLALVPDKEKPREVLIAPGPHHGKNSTFGGNEPEADEEADYLREMGEESHALVLLNGRYPQAPFDWSQLEKYCP